MKTRQWLPERAPATSDGVTTHGEADLVGTQRGRALLALRRGAASMGLTTTLAQAPTSAFALRFTDATGLTLDVFVERRAQRSYFRDTDVLGLWYAQPSGAPARPWVMHMLNATAKVCLSSGLEQLALELAPPAPVVAPTDPVAAPAHQRPSTPYSRLNVLGATDAERFFHVDYDYEEGSEAGGDLAPTSRVGIIYQCNQPCTFCQLAEMNTHIPPARIYEAIDASRARGSRRLILTGGEPTLCKHLLDYVRHAGEIGFTTIELQTNATLLDDLSMARRLRDAGLTDAQVSLHGPDSAISDRLTAAPGTHARTLAGIGNLLEVGVRVLLNHLVFRDNQHLLVEFVEMVDRRWGAHRAQLILQFHSPLDEFTRPEMAQKHISKYTEYSDLLCQAIDLGRQKGYSVKDLQDPTGVPALCVLDANPGYLGPIISQRKRPRFHRWESTWLTRVEACQTCDLADTCMGIPRAYLNLHGDAEFHPLRLDPTDGSLVTRAPNRRDV